MGKPLLYNKKVAIFQEPIVIDRRLPKWQSEKSNSYKKAENAILNNKNMPIILSGTNLLLKPEDVNGFFNTNNEFENIKSSRWRSEGQSLEYSGNAITRFFRRLSAKVKRARVERKEREFDILEFFSNVKLKAEQTPVYVNRVNKYLSYLQYADKCGQTALREKLMANMVINYLESVLFAAGKFKLLTEEDIIAFAENSPKALCLDYINNYVRVIPNEVIEKKMEFDELEVFDNYVILHYDFDGGSTDMTQEEKKKEVAKAKDPILFGVINGSKKLYYIGDWIDEYCDLTLDKIVEVLGKDTVESKYLTEDVKM